MSEPNKVEELEKRLNFITQTLIRTQTDLSQVREELSQIRGEKVEPRDHTESTPVAVSIPPKIAVPIEKPKPIVEAKPKRNVEEFIGGRILTIIGIVVLLIGLAVLTMAAIEGDILGPVGRVLIGIAFGLALLGTSYRMITPYAVFGAVLLGGGMACLYFSTYAAYDFYGLLPQSATFVMLTILTAFTVLAAARYNQQTIGVLGLAAAYAVPFLCTSNSGGTGLIILSYVTLINVGILIVAFQKSWRIMNYAAFAATWGVFTIYYSTRYTFEHDFLPAILFATIFFLMFYAMFAAFKFIRKESFSSYDLARLLTNSFVYFGFGYALLVPFHQKEFLGLFTLLIAAVHAAFAALIQRRGLADRHLFYALMAMALLFVAIAIPIQLDGNWVTLAWIAGAAILFWLGRSRGEFFYEYASGALIFLSCISLFHDWQYWDDRTRLAAEWIPILNITFFSGLWTMSMLGFMVWLAFGNKFPHPKNSLPIKIFSGTALFIVSYFVFHQEIGHTLDRLFELSRVVTKDTYLDSLSQGDQIFDHVHFDEDLRIFKTIWLFVYSGIFLSITSWFCNYRWKVSTLSGIQVSINVMVFLVFIGGILFSLGQLRGSYLTPAADSVFYPKTWMYIGIRYPVFIAACLNFALTLQILKSMAFRGKGYLPVAVHTMVLIVLGSELTTWSMIFSGSPDVAKNYAQRIGFSILWGLYSLALIWFGIAKRRKMLRLIGIGLFSITFLKIYFYDLRDMGFIEKIMLFIPFGLILLLVSFLYQKYKTIILGEDEA